MEEIEISQWLFQGRLRQCKNVLPDGLNWLCYFAGSSKSHRENFLFYVVPVKSKAKISKKFMAFSEYMNFNNLSFIYFRVWNKHTVMLINFY
jgi:hypothetical protein